MKAANIEAEFYKNRKGLPTELRNKMDEANRVIAANQKNMADHQAELARINDKYDETEALPGVGQCDAGGAGRTLARFW